MAGRPRTMLKRVRKLLERHQKLTEELRDLGKHHMPKPGEQWDFHVPGGDVDPIPPLWRTAVFKAGCVDDDIDDLLCFLELKVEKIEQKARLEADNTADDPDDDVDQPESPADCANHRIPNVGELQIGQGIPAGQDAVQVAIS